MTNEQPKDDIPAGPLTEAVPPVREKPGPLSMAQALFQAIGDTFKDMIREGQEEAERAHNEAWHRYDELTKHRKELKARKDD